MGEKESANDVLDGLKGNGILQQFHRGDQDTGKSHVEKGLEINKTVDCLQCSCKNSGPKVSALLKRPSFYQKG